MKVLVTEVRPIPLLRVVLAHVAVVVVVHLLGALLRMVLGLVSVRQADMATVDRVRAGKEF